MKIACVGNMNNMMFTLCRYLRDEGYDAHLLVFKDEPTHFDPSADSYLNDYKSFTTYLPVNNELFYGEENYMDVKKIISKFDFFIGSDYAPALLESLGQILNVFIPHGSDIYDFPFVRKKNPETDEVWWLKSILYSGKLQLKGVRRVQHILFPDEYDEQFNFRSRLKTNANFHNTSGPMLYVPQYEAALENQDLLESLDYSAKFSEIRNNHDLVIFSHTRHNGFSLPSELNIHLKGNDVLIKGVEQFIQKNPNIKIKLILFDYGMNVEASKRLIDDLDIGQYVEWVPKMSRKEILVGLSKSDIACGEFENSWLTCGVVNEALALGKPLLHYRDDSMYVHLNGDLYSVLNVESEKDVEDHLLNYTKNREEICQKSKENINWIEKQTVLKPMNIIKQILIESTVKQEVSRLDRIFNRFLRFQLGLKLFFAKIKQKVL